MLHSEMFITFQVIHMRDMEVSYVFIKQQKLNRQSCNVLNWENIKEKLNSNRKDIGNTIPTIMIKSLTSHGKSRIVNPPSCSSCNLYNFPDVFVCKLTFPTCVRPRLIEKFISPSPALLSPIRDPQWRPLHKNLGNSLLHLLPQGAFVMCG